MADDSSIPELLACLGRDEAASAAAVLVRYQPWLHLLARLQIDQRFQGKFAASDIVQQTLLEAYKGLPQFRGSSEAELLAWLRQILAHVLSHEIRKYHGTQQRDLALEVSLADSSQRLNALLADPGSSPSQQAMRHEQEVMLAEVLARLPEDYREVIILRNLEGLSHREIADRLGRGEGAVRMLWMRALAKLREELNPFIG